MKRLNACYAIFQILLCLILNSNSNKTYSQNDHFLYVIPNEEKALPKENDIYTNSDILNAVFKNFQVTTYKLAFPRAEHPDLAVTYKVHSIGDVYELKKELAQTEMFRTIELQGYWVLTSCPNPVPINDPFTVYGYNQTPWQLEMIEAGCAWEITEGNANVIIGIPDSEFRTTHEDFAGKFVSVWNPTSFYPDPHCNHGSSVGSMAAANANNYVGVAGIGNKCRLAGYVVPSFKVTDSTPCQSFDLGEAVWQAHLDGRKIINVSWSGVGMLSPTILTAIKQIVSNGTTLVVAAGNKITDTHHSGYANVPGVINVSNVNIENKLGPTNCARNQWVDLCAPGHSVFTVSSDGDNQYTESWGTSFSAPGVAGTVGLMLSVNPCMPPAQIEAIIKASADPVADGYLYPGLHGAGRLNAYEAVKAAQDIYKPANVDFHLRDSDMDYGEEPNASTEPYWVCTDMWMRKVDDGIEQHQNIPYDASDPTAWMYARIRNIGCLATLTSSKVQFYWAHASATLGWTFPWDGFTFPPNPAKGGFIGEAPIYISSGGDEVIVKVKWNNIPNPAIFPSGFPFPTNPNPGFSILGRIVSAADPMYGEGIGGTAVFENNVRNNNNIALRTVQVGIPIIEPEFAGLSNGAQGAEAPVSGYHSVPMSTIIGNSEEVAGTYDLEFSMPNNERLPYITDLAEVRVHLDSVSWEKWLAGGRQAEGVRLIDEEMFEFVVTGPVARFENLYYEPQEYSNAAITVHFLTEEFAEKDESQYELLWKEHGTGKTVGGNRFIFMHPERGENELFFAQLESRMLLNNSAGGNLTELRAEPVAENVSYKWYTADTLTLLDTGRIVYLNDTQSAEAGILEVSSGVDGYKDYYDLSANTMMANNTSPHYISTIAPNPASNQATVNYHIAAALSVQSAKLRITSVNNPQSVQSFTINPTSGNYQIQLGALPAGVYIVSLYCDNQLCDSKGLTVQ